ncbi:UNVERIFIED_CONTAM: hypothetical protein HDU68_006858 [Siphonaria sp. JEL0065]|nr:hypothetical protein HDU68_006858 [Siphonaria sp. JEL0065]
MGDATVSPDIKNKLGGKKKRAGGGGRDEAIKVVELVIDENGNVIMDDKDDDGATPSSSYTANVESQQVVIKDGKVVQEKKTGGSVKKEVRDGQEAPVEIVMMDGEINHDTLQQLLQNGGEGRQGKEKTEGEKAVGGKVVGGKKTVVQGAPKKGTDLKEAIVQLAEKLKKFREQMANNRNELL